MEKKCSLTASAIFVVGIIAICCIPGVFPYGSGAPGSTCLTRYPKHSHTSTQSSASPFKITLQGSSYTPGDKINVTITSDAAKSFTGFQLAGFRKDNPLEAVGQFTAIPEDKAKTFTCLGGYKNMVTHKNKNSVTSAFFEWTAPSYNAGDIIFKATVVEGYTIFWTNLEAPLTSSSLATIRPPAYENVPTSEIVQDVNLVGCGDKKACFLYPRHCDDNDCVAAVSFEYKVDQGLYQVEMYADADSNPAYVGVAFSTDRGMGHDETFICAANTAEMSVQHGYNPAKYNERIVTQYVSDAQVKRVDGRIECRFVMDPNATVTRVNQAESADSSSPVLSYDDFLKDYAWHIQLAWGPIMADSNVVTLHKEMPAVTSSKVHIKDAGVYRGSAFPVLVQIHAAVMIVAWTFLSGIVTVIARHYREMAPSRRVCGTKVWFQLHRGLASLVAILTGVGIAVIFIHYGSTIREAAKPHAYWGIAVTAAVGLQIVAGILRPGPDHKLRVVFNWGHRFLGHASHIVAAVTMFLAFDIDYITEEMHTFGFIVLAVWAGVQLMWHLFFEVVGCLLRRNTSDSYSVEGSKDSDGKGSWIPTLLMIIYVLFLAACCAAVMCAFLLY